MSLDKKIQGILEDSQDADDPELQEIAARMEKGLDAYLTADDAEKKEYWSEYLSNMADLYRGVNYLEKQELKA
jgi:hypothetical protein